MNRVAWSFVVFVVLAGPMPAQETLAWKFQVGTSFQIESVDKSKRVLLWDKNETTRQSIDTWVRKYTVRKVTATEIVLDQTIVSVSSEGPAWASLPTPLATIADKLKGCTFRVTISPTGRVLKLEGYDNFVKKMSDGQADSEKSIRAACPESSVRKWLEDTLAYLPEKAVKPGDRWQRESQSASFSGTYKSVIEYEYKGATTVRTRLLTLKKGPACRRPRLVKCPSSGCPRKRRRRPV